MLRLWQVVEQDLVHSLYFIPIGHLGTEKHREKHNLESPFNYMSTPVHSPQADLTALALLQPSVQKYPVCLASAGVLQQDGAVTVLAIPLVAVTRLPLTEFQERLWRHQVRTVQEHRGSLEQTAAGQDLQHKHFMLCI